MHPKYPIRAASGSTAIDISLIRIPPESLGPNGEIDLTVLSNELGGEPIITSEAVLNAYIAVAEGDPSTSLGAIVASEITLAAPVTVPANLILTFTPAGSFTKSESATIEFEGVGVSGDPDWQIFSGFDPGEVEWVMATPSFRPEWFGAVGDGVNDDLPAFQHLRLVAPSHEDQSIHIPLTSNKHYLLNGTWEMDQKFYLEGDGGDNWAATTELNFPVNTIGLVVHHVGTRTGINDGRSAIFSRIRGVGFIGSNGFEETHTIDTSGLTLTKTAGQDFSHINGYADGVTVTLGGFTYVIQTVDSTTEVTIYKPRTLIRATYGRTNAGIADYNSLPTGGQWDGQDITLDGDTYTMSSIAAGVITLADPYLGSVNAPVGSVAATGAASSDALTATAHGMISGQYGYFVATTGVLPTGLSLNTPVYIINDGANSIKFATSRTNALAGTAIPISGGSGDHTFIIYGFVGNAEVQSLAATSDNSARANKFHGIVAKASVEISHCKIWSFPGSGIALDSITGLSPFPETTPNNNNSYIVRNSAYYNIGHGIWAKGINSNQSYITNNDVTNNHGAGIFEASFLGNNYFGNHTSFNYFSAMYGVGPVNVSQFYGHYDEGGQPSALLDTFMKADGGNWASGFDPESSGGLIYKGNYGIEMNGFRVQNTSEDVVAILVPTDQHNTMFGFGSATEPSNLGGGGSLTSVARPQYQIGFNQLATGWYDLYAGGSYPDHSKSVLAFSGELASGGNGILALPTGFRTQVTDPHVSRVLSGTATLNFDLSSNPTEDLTITVTGAAVGDSVFLGVPNDSVTADTIFFAWVSSADTVTVRAMRIAGTPDPTSGTFRATVMKFAA